VGGLADRSAGHANEHANGSNLREQLVSVHRRARTVICVIASSYLKLILVSRSS
jgi:hypothetical protein